MLRELGYLEHGAWEEVRRGTGMWKGAVRAGGYDLRYWTPGSKSPVTGGGRHGDNNTVNAYNVQCFNGREKNRKSWGRGILLEAREREQEEDSFLREVSLGQGGSRRLQKTEAESKRLELGATGGNRTGKGASRKTNVCKGCTVTRGIPPNIPQS